MQLNNTSLYKQYPCDYYKTFIIGFNTSEEVIYVVSKIDISSSLRDSHNPLTFTSTVMQTYPKKVGLLGNYNKCNLTKNTSFENKSQRHV